MLHRSFKPAKCKTALKLAVSRIKLLKNKREAQLKQIKRDVAQLLESGQDQTAKIRVEHVIREEKTMAAYDLVEVYCELIAARLPIIESQKNCPIDLKEAVTSVIFASPRCSDIPELMDIRKHFTAKYGKDFISAAVELRPECGVSSNLVEKLSAKAPDGQTKIKILTAIAEENNIKWEPRSFEETESNTPEVLLSGPDTFEKASKIQMEPLDLQPPLSHVQKPAAAVNPSLRSPQHSQSMSSPGSQNISSTDCVANKATMSGSAPEPRPSGNVFEDTGFRQSYSGTPNPFSPGGQNWTMEFKDATAAAQAAAESAEQASMAARAAAELSSRGRFNPQYSTESQKSSAFDFRGEGPEIFDGLRFREEHPPKVSASISLHDRNSRSQNKQMDRNQRDNMGGVSERLCSDGNYRNSSRSSSLISNSSSMDEVKISQMSDSYSQRSSYAVDATNLEKGNLFKQSAEPNTGFLSEPQGDMKNENADYSGNVRIKRESSGDAYNEISNLNSLRFDNDAGENPFTGPVPGNGQRESKEANSYHNDHVVFDDYGSDDNDYPFEVENKDHEEDLCTDWQSVGRKSPTHVSANTSAWSPGHGRSEHIERFSSQSNFPTEWCFRDSSGGPEESNSEAPPQQPEESLPVTFDDSDGLSTESEKELGHPKFSGRTDPSSVHLFQNVLAKDTELTQNETRELEGSAFVEKGYLPWLGSSSDDSDTTVPKRNHRRELKAESQKFGSSDMPPSRSSPGTLKSMLDQNDVDHDSFNPVAEEKHLQSQQSFNVMENTEVGGQSGLETWKELNFETLKGGFRNKGYKHPPYAAQPSRNASSLSKQTDDDATPSILLSFASPSQQSTEPPLVKSLAGNAIQSQEGYNQEAKAKAKANKKSTSRSRPTYFDSDSEDSEEQLPELPQDRGKKESYSQKAGVKANTKLSSKGLSTYFGMDDDSEEDIPKPATTSKGRPTSSFSRRTKAPLNSETSSYLKSAVTADLSMASDDRAAGKPSSRRSYAAETMTEAPSQTISRGQRERKSEPRNQTKSPGHEESSGRHRSSEQQRSDPVPDKVETTSSSSVEPTYRENSLKKASHVHPMLPDYETLAARIQSLRVNRQ